VGFLTLGFFMGFLKNPCLSRFGFFVIKLCTTPNSFFILFRKMDNDSEAASMPDTKRKPGRTPDEAWSLFSTVENASRLKSLKCDHCGYVLKTPKIERVKDHLRTCDPFKKKYKKDDINTPDWLYSKSSKTFGSSSVGGSIASSSQSRITSHFNKKMSKSELDKFYYNLAMHFYLSGTSYYRVEEPFLQKAFEVLRPGTERPTRQLLGGPLLDLCYERVLGEVTTYLKALPKTQYACLTTDAATDVNSSDIVNYMVVVGGKSLLLQQENTQGGSHSAEWITKRILETTALVQEKMHVVVAGVCTDNTNTNKNAWTACKAERPEMFLYGCAAHALHLFVKDIFAATKTIKNSTEVNIAAALKTPMYPPGYCFEHLMDFCQGSKELVSFFRNHHALRAELDKKQTEAEVPGLVEPGFTRWGTMFTCLCRIEQSLDLIYGIVNGRTFISDSPHTQLKAREKVKLFVNNESFATSLASSVAILRVIDKYLTRFQGDYVPLSDVYHAFMCMKKEFKELDGNVLSKAQVDYLLAQLQTRMQFIVRDVHRIAYLLDPRYLGEEMSTAEKTAAENAIWEYKVPGVALTGDDLKTELCKEYTRFLIRAMAGKEAADFRFKMLEKRTKTILQYWQVDGTEYKYLQVLGCRVFSLAVSSTASERGFSRNKFNHSVLRNRLSAASVEKLNFISINGKQFAPSTFNYEELDKDEGEEEEDEVDKHIVVLE
jgi:hypothetical protein